MHEKIGISRAPSCAAHRRRGCARRIALRSTACSVSTAAGKARKAHEDQIHKGCDSLIGVEDTSSVSGVPEFAQPLIRWPIKPRRWLDVHRASISAPLRPRDLADGRAAAMRLPHQGDAAGHHQQHEAFNHRTSIFESMSRFSPNAEASACGLPGPSSRQMQAPAPRHPQLISRPSIRATLARLRSACTRWPEASCSGFEQSAVRRAHRLQSMGHAEPGQSSQH